MKKTITILLTLILTISLSACGAKMSEKGENAIECVQTLVDYLKVPDSLKLRKIIVADFADEEYLSGLSHRYCFIEYTAENSYGAATRSTSIFVDGYYLNDLDELQDTDKRTKKTIDYVFGNLSSDEKIIFEYESGALKLNIALKDKTINENDYEIVSCKTIGQKLKIDYVD